MKRILYWTSGVLMMLLGISLLYPELTAQVLAHAAPDTSIYANWLATHVMGTGIDGVAMATAAVALPLPELRQKIGELTTKQREILDKADTEKRSRTAEETSQYEAIEAEVQPLMESLAHHEARERLSAREADLSRLQTRGIRPEVEGRRETATAAITDEVRQAMTPEAREKCERLATKEYRAAYGKYLTLGRNALTIDELRALSVGTATEGGYTVPTEEFRPEIIKAIDDANVIRTIARVLPPVAQAQGLGIPTLSADPADSDWTSELATGSEDATMAFGKRELHPYPLAKRIKVSKKLLRASPIGMASFVPQRLGYKTGIAQAKAFNTGLGANQPLGIFTASPDGIPTTRDVEIGDGAGAVADTKVIDARYTLKQGYAMSRSARWIMHRLWFAKIRKLKATTGDYLWQPGLSRGDPVGMTLLDIPVVIDEYSPSVTTHGAGVYAAVVGDFDYYWIVDALGQEIQRLEELYAESNQMGFIIRSETDGMPVLSEAFVRLIAAT